jgi:CBS domain-containing protein
MKASDVMTPNVISVRPDTPVSEIAELMLDYQISATPVIEHDALVGMVSEGDLLRRAETRTERRRSRWIAALTPNSDLAADYVKTHGRTARDVMTQNVVTISEETTLADIAEILESRRIKRVPVMRGKRVVGIVSRANLLQALASRSEARSPTAATSDQTIRDTLFAELREQKWAVKPHDTNIIVHDGVVDLWGVVQSDEERKAMIVAAEGVPGVRRVEDHMSFPIPPMF